MPESTEYGRCHCGCGEQTNLATMTSTKKGHRKGKPLRYVRGHQNRGRPAPNRGVTRGPIDECDYEIRDCGYETPCWCWRHAHKDDGYGKVTVARRTRGAHVVMLEQLGVGIAAGMHVDHLCRQRDCVNPDHLEVVTPQENGRRQSNVKLTREQVAEIRASTEPSNVLALRYPVASRQIRRIRQGVRWHD